MNGIKDGIGKETRIDGSIYEGDFKRGNKHGNGYYKWKTGDEYQGNFVANNIQGLG